MKKKVWKKVAVIAAIVLVVALGAAALIYFSGYSDKVLGVFGIGDGEQTTQPGEDSAPVSSETLVPSESDKLKAVWLDCSATQEQVKNALSTIGSMGFNSVVLFGEDTAAISAAVEYAGGIGLYTFVAADAKSVMSVSNEMISINEPVLRSYLETGASGFMVKNVTSQELGGSLSGLPGITEITNGISALRTTAKEIRPQIYFGACVSEIWANTSVSATGFGKGTKQSLVDYLCDSKGWMDARLLDYIYVETDTVLDDDVISYADMIAWWGGVSGQSGIKLYFGHMADRLFSDDKWSDPDEIVKQVSATDGVMQCAGNGFFSSTSILENKQDTTRALADYLVNRVLVDSFKELIITSPSKTEVTTNESSISFVGAGDINNDILLNGEKLEVNSEGYFSLSKTLSPGKNTFVFTQKDKTLTYTVKYDIALIKSVSPTGNVTAPGGTAIELSAIAIKGATVTATVAGKSITLTKTSYAGDNVKLSSDSDYSYFVGNYTMPASTTVTQNLGNVTFRAKYNSLSESKTGAAVKVSAEIPITDPPTTARPVTTAAPTTTEPPTDPPTVPPTTATPTTTELLTDENGVTIEAPPETTAETTTRSSHTKVTTTAAPTTTNKPATTQGAIQGMVTPYAYAGVSGYSKMCEVTKPYAETMPVSPLNDFSVPVYSPLPKGTFDYITGEASYNGIEYYILGSGRRVYKDSVKLISSGFNMPSNSISVVESSTTAGDSTNIVLSMKWKVPFNQDAKPVSYFTEIAGRPYSVSSFNATYVDFTFYYTGSVSGKPNVSGSSIIQSAEWISSSSPRTVTLRLHLKSNGGFYGAKCYYFSNGTLCISVKERTSSSLSGKVIMLDPGHGGSDPGALGVIYSGGSRIQEQALNLAIAKKIKTKLEAKGATVVMTRSSESFNITLDERVLSCRNLNPDIFVSVHCNASDSSSSAHGTMSFYYKSYSQPLAKAIHTQLVSAYTNTIYAGSSMRNGVDRGAKFGPYRVTRVEECPSVLVEYGFVTNVTECNVLAGSTNQNTLAQATVNGIENYFRNS